LNPSKVLIVDDNTTTLMLMSKFIKDIGHLPIKKSSGKDAIEFIKENYVDIVLIDYHLDDMMGSEVIKIVKSEINSKLPFIILSGDSAETTIMEGLVSGAEEFLIKPFNRDILKFRINNTLEKVLQEKKMIELTLKLEREKTLLRKYFPEDVVEEILNETIVPEIGGISVVATILFFDLRGSTSIAEKKHPSEFAEFLSLIFTDIMDLIYGHSGSVNKLLGDGILATFGCPLYSENDISNALKCAIAIDGYFDIFNSLNSGFTENPISFGIGIATGRVFAGNVGSFKRMEYTVLGDPVNIASRLESTTKELGVKILVDSNTVNDEDAKQFLFKKSDKNTIRGRHGEVEIYELAGLKT
jgi:adenylate cyclase